MPGKSRHGKRKQIHYSKKSKAIMRQGTAAVAPMDDGTVEAARPAAATAAPAGMKSAAARAEINEYPYVAGELKSIAILGGAIIVILVILSFILT